MKINEHGRITFSSGTEFQDGAGAIGLSHDFNVCGGYDQQQWSLEETQYPNVKQNYSVADMQELAVYMVAKWSEFKARLDALSQSDGKTK
jgi:hypothetical protein